MVRSFLDSRTTQVQDPTETYQFAYDNMGRMKNATVTYSSLPGRTFSIAYGYDLASNRTAMTDPQNGVTNYTYDTPAPLLLNSGRRGLAWATL